MPNSPFIMPISEEIWGMKYQFKAEDGTPIDTSVDDTQWRIANALSKAEKPELQQFWAGKFRNILKDFAFLNAGRITAGAGTDRNVTLSNCFTMDTIDDDLGDIYRNLREAALTMKEGGGIGYDFSTLRPSGSLVKGVSADSSGPLSFMDNWDSMCYTIMSAGGRRGAMMATMRCDHPDIFNFIAAKADPARLRRFNMSILVTDKFMDAVKADGSIDLVFGDKVYDTVSARHLWDTMMQATYDYAEPGVIFIDRVNRDHNIGYLETIATTNPSMPAGTMVHTDKGIFPIESLENQNFKVKSLDGVWADANCFLSSDNAEVLEINLGGGKTVRSTKEHRWPVECNGRYLKSYASDLKPGDRIPLCLNESLGLQEGDLTYNDGLATGLTYGDGSYNIRNDDGRAYLSVSVNKLDDDIRNFLCSYFNCNYSDRDSEYQINFCRDQDVRDFIAKVGLTFGDKTKLPDTIWNQNDQFISGFIAGMFGSDGHVHTKNRCLVYTSKEEAAVREFGLLLGFHGVNVTFRSSQSNGFDRTDLVITFGSVKRFNNLFHIGCQRKSLALSTFVNMTARQHISSTHQVVESVRSVSHEKVWDISVEHNQHVFPTEWCYTGNCGEKPMGPYASCLLSSANLSQFVVDPFGSNAHLDVVRLVETVSVGTRMMDNVVDVGRFPLEAQLEKAKSDRQLGLGITGLADMLAMLGIRYGSDEAAEYSEQVMKQIHLSAYKTSIALAREKGAFPTFDADGFLREGTAASRLPADMQDDIANGGIRNALLTSIAPTGTISLYANNVSSGIEPTFAHEYTRNVTQKDGSRIGQRVVSYAKARWEEINGEGTPMPDYCVTTAELSPTEHIKMQAAVQKWVDSSISKTVNVPEDIEFDAFTSVYMEAYDTGCKGCTTYRPNDITGSILTIDEPEKVEEVSDQEVNRVGFSHVLNEKTGQYEYIPVRETTLPMERPEFLEGSTYKLKWPGDEHAIYVTINDAMVGEQAVPFEIFINSKNMEHHQWVSALTRMISAVFRRGGDVSFVAEELKAVFDPNGGMFFKQKFVPSIIAAIGGVIEEHLWRTGYIEAGQLPVSVPEEVEVTPVKPTGPYCPQCKSTNYIMSGGCATCGDCGHSKCG